MALRERRLTHETDVQVHYFHLSSFCHGNEKSFYGGYMELAVLLDLG